MSQCTTTQDVLVKLEQAVERGDVPYLHALLINQNLTGEIVGFFNGSQTLLHRACIYGARECVIALLTLGANPHAVDDDVEERRQGVQRAGRHHDDVYAVLRGAGRRRAVERRRRQREFFLSRPRLCVLGSDVAAAHPRRRRRSDGRGASRQCPGGVARRAGADFFGRALTASSAPRSSGGDASRPAGA